MFNISKDVAPPFKMIEPFFKFGSILYLISIIALLFIDSNNSLNDFTIVGWTHLFLLGFVMVVIFGAMAQLVPVVLEVGHFSIDLYYIIFPTLAIGSILMVLGFWFYNQLLPYGGLLVLVSMAIFLFETLKTLQKTDANTLTVKCVKAGNIFLTIAIAIGFLMALAISLGVGVDLGRLLPIHVMLVLFGYVTITIIGISMVLLPMFGLAHGFDSSDVERSFKIIVYSIIAFTFFKLIGLDFLSNIALLAVAVGIFFYLKQLKILYDIRARKIIDIWYKHIYVAFISLAIATIFGIFWLFFGWENFLKVSIWLYVLGFVSFVINGHLLKIIPFLVWFERFSPLVGKKRVPMLHEMLPNKDVEFSFWLSLAGLIIGTFGLLIFNDDIFKGAVTLLSFGAIFMLKSVLYILNFKEDNYV